MDIHKPKPWHSFREFLKEYLIIVVGVLTALAGEQAVETLHWRHVLGEAREALSADQIRNLRWVAERDAESPCIAREARALGAALDQAAETGRLPAVANVSGPARRPWTLNSYDAIVSSQALAHLSTQDQLLFAAHHGWSEYLSHTRDTEVRDWDVLRTMEGPGRKVGDAEIAQLRAALSEAIQQHDAMRLGSQELAHRMMQTGLTAKAAADTWAAGVKDAHDFGTCAPSHMGRNEFLLRRSETPRRPFPAWPPQPATDPRQ
jgi:hypothetical protein